MAYTWWIPIMNPCMHKEISNAYSFTFAQHQESNHLSMPKKNLTSMTRHLWHSAVKYLFNQLFCICKINVIIQRPKKIKMSDSSLSGWQGGDLQTWRTRSSRRREYLDCCGSWSWGEGRRRGSRRCRAECHGVGAAPPLDPRRNRRWAECL